MRKSLTLVYLQNLVDMKFMQDSINHSYERPLVHGIERFSTKSGNAKTKVITLEAGSEWGARARGAMGRRKIERESFPCFPTSLLNSK